MDLVAAVVEKLAADGRAEFRPGDVVSRLREQNQPMGTWEVRGELAKLEAEGMIENDADTGAWRLAAQRSLKTG
ncbi:MAG: hypothetical protein U5Q16_03955 [Gammaproteobacteria bacterium]|nr:hypothetical protein [Gammaproteobacteria bacterium]